MWLGISVRQVCIYIFYVEGQVNTNCCKIVKSGCELWRKNTSSGKNLLTSKLYQLFVNISSPLLHTCQILFTYFFFISFPFYTLLFFLAQKVLDIFIFVWSIYTIHNIICINTTGFNYLQVQTADSLLWSYSLDSTQPQQSIIHLSQLEYTMCKANRKSGLQQQNACF